MCIANCDYDIRQSLRNLPRDLEDTFSRALSRILSRQRRAELVQKVFRWVAAAIRPLTLDEIREAVSIDIGQPSIKPERLVREMSAIGLWCENLLQVSEEEPPCVQFAHSTIRDFITTADLPAHLVGFHVDLEEADHFAGEICVTYLHLNDFRTTVVRRPQPLRVNPVSVVTTVREQEPNVAELVIPFVKSGFRHRKAEAGPHHAIATDTYKRLNGHQQSHPFLK